MTAFPEPSYAVHFQCSGPRPNGNATDLAPPTVTGRTCVVFPSGLVTEEPSAARPSQSQS
jgi:hypothetical protein